MKTTADWWASLTITEKERIAGKITGREVFYPECTAVWNSLSQEKKEQIESHCTFKHGDVLLEWKDGKPYGD